MSNSEIADILELTSKLLDLYDADENRIKTYGASSFTISRLEQDLSSLSEKEMLSIRGLGRLMVASIKEIIETGKLAELEELIAQTPVGVFKMFKIKGLGVKKIKGIWKNLGIDNPKDLKIACENGTIAAEKGFGAKTAQSILESMQFLAEQEGKLRLDKGILLSQFILEVLKLEIQEIIEVGPVIRRNEIIDKLQFLVKKDGFGGIKISNPDFIQESSLSSPSKWAGTFKENSIPLEIIKTSSQDFLKNQLILNSNEEHLKLKNPAGLSLLQHIGSTPFQTEEEAYRSFGYNFIVPEMREGRYELAWSVKNTIDSLIQFQHLKGTLHNHSTYSDGKNTLSQMAEAAQNLGLGYFGIADHSQTATYAGGLLPEKVKVQHAEIDHLNAFYTDFRILKGIESDILPSGDLDYEKDILASFDYVVASVHAVLNMDLEKATTRLLKAIENPYTNILGHLSGRLLLSRAAYPLDYKKIIDACAANKVSIELNASPYRLDIDWRYIDYCMEKGVMVSINPDAHETAGLLDMHYGVMSARKGGLITDFCLNALPIDKILSFFKK
jgi:DNA polymerase (family X)